MDKILIYTDGSSRGNPGPGGFGAILMWAGKTKEIHEAYRKTTNNRMELLAVIVGLEKLKNPKTKVLVVSDSKYVVDAVEKRWVFQWEKINFKAKKNPDLWMRFLKVYRKHQVDFQWVKGHNNHPQNERCDELAVMASQQEKLSIDEFYEREEGKLL